MKTAFKVVVCAVVFSGAAVVAHSGGVCGLLSSCGFGVADSSKTCDQSLVASIASDEPGLKVVPAAAAEQPLRRGVVGLAADVAARGIPTADQATLDERVEAFRRTFGGSCGVSMAGVGANGEPFAACFDPANPPSPAVMAAVERAMREFLAENPQFNAVGSWRVDGSGNPTSFNTPITLTWSFVPDGLPITGGTGPRAGFPNTSSLFSTLDSQFAGRGGRATWIAQFQACFDRWSALTGTNYTRVTFGGNDWDDGASWGSVSATGRRGDIRISMRDIDGGSGILAFNSFPPNGDMVLDASDTWSNGTSFLFMRNVIMHEHGHGLGLAHVCPANQSKLMEPFISTAYDGPQLDDIRAIHQLYGDALEPNNNLSTASVLGPIGTGVTLNPSAVPAPAVINGAITSISIAGDTDFYRLTTSTPLLVNIAATPVGISYTDVDQNQDGSCQAGGVTTDALRQATLIAQVFTNLGTQIGGAQAPSAGNSASLTNFLLSPPGDWVIRVNSTGFLGPQLYNLTVTGGVVPAIAATTNSFPDRIRVTWTNVPSATAYRLFRNSANDRASATQIATPAAGVAFYDDLTAAGNAPQFYWLEAQVGISFTWRPVAGPAQGSFTPPPPVCVADYNGDTVLNSDDISDYITDYFTVPAVAGPGGYAVPCPGAPSPYNVSGYKVDFIQDCAVNTDDISDFITAYFTGC